MNKLRSLLTLGLLPVFTHIMGYTITVNPIQIEAGQSTSLVINLNNAESNLTAYQMSIYLPQGITIQKKVNGKYAYTANADRHDGTFTISLKDAADGSVLIACFSADKDVLTGTNGELIRLPIDVDSKMTFPQAGSIKNIEFTDDNSQAHKHADVMFNFMSSSIPATGISLNQNMLSFIAANQTAQLTATVTPSNATNKSVTWASSNTAVAIVSNTGVVTSKANGTAIITAKTADGTNLTATCTCSVTISSASSITFDDSAVKATCVSNWDKDGDGELSKEEAAAVTDLGTVFQNKNQITSFDELQYFTGLESIGNKAFYGCKAMTSIIIPENLSSIGSYAFYACSGLKSINIPNSVTTIDNYAFADCSSLTAVYITDLLAWCNISYGNSTSQPLSFAHHLYLNGVEVTRPNIPSGITKINDYAFKDCTGLTSVVFSPSVLSIGKSAFNNCDGLTEVYIPSSVTSIDNYAFYKCSALTDVYCYAEVVPNTNTNAFNASNYKAATLHVPTGSIGAYSTTTPWSNFGRIVSANAKYYVISDETTSLSIAAEESGSSVEFTHNFNGEWEALYLPFAINYDDIKSDFDLAEIDGVVQNDDNNDGIADITVLSIMGFRGQKTEPNTPYLIRAKQAGEQTIDFENITIYPTNEVTFNCSSFNTKYEFTGYYSTLNASGLTNRYIVQNGELVKGAITLAPCRWYMTAKSRKGTLDLPNRIRIMPVEDVITGVENFEVEVNNNNALVYDINGCKLSVPKKGINIIRYSDGMTKKVLVK